MAVQAAFIVGPLMLGGYVAWRKLWWVLAEFRPHTHGEKNGAPLTEAGINYPRSMNEK